MQGILIVDKPADFTSFDVVAKLRGILGTRKIGHSGTLDPMATGVLPCFIGKAAKAVDMQQCHDKAYEATVRFGIATDTGDITGNELRRDDSADLSEAQFIKALGGIVGKQLQVPPMYSAVKIGGVPLYKLARKGELVERPPREIEVYKAEYLNKIHTNEYRFYVECSRGSYVRCMCEDLGDRLSVPATMSALRRVQAGKFMLKDAYTLGEIQSAKDEGTLQSLLLGVDSLFTELAAYELNDEGYVRLLNGAICKAELPNAQYRLMYKGSFVGVCSISEAVLGGVKLFCERE